MERSIVGYHRDSQDDWVAELACGHRQHVRHLPPFQLREWVLLPEERNARLGSPLDCPLCDRAELPEGLQRTRISPRWSEETMPPGLRRNHRIGVGSWGQILVHEGRLRFTAQTQPVLDVIVDSGSMQAIPPEVEHYVEPLGSVSFSVEFLSIPTYQDVIGAHEDETLNPSIEKNVLSRSDKGGESACFAHILCPECGAVLNGGAHKLGCNVG